MTTIFIGNNPGQHCATAKKWVFRQDGGGNLQIIETRRSFADVKGRYCVLYCSTLFTTKKISKSDPSKLKNLELLRGEWGGGVGIIHFSKRI